jgi:hypothetical protein
LEWPRRECDVEGLGVMRNEHGKRGEDA